MKKVALITCYFQHNYGSQLQAFATQWLFDRLQINNETICIDGLCKDIYNAKYRYFLKRIFDVNTIKDKLPVVRKKLATLRNKTLKENIALRDRQFNNFAQQMFHLSAKYKTKDEIAQHYDAFVVGSDQLWLPSNIEADYYTLNFVPDCKPKISLATSFGVTGLPRRQAQKAKEFLNRFDALSVREPSGVSIVKTLIGREAKQIVDPTMMLTANDWLERLTDARVVPNPYIFCYFLGNRSLPRAFALQLKSATGLPVVHLPHCDDYVATDEQLFDTAIYDANCFDLLRLIRDASYVLTDSFHATVFATLFNKQYFTFRRYATESAVSTNSRLTSLLSTLNLSDHMLHGNEDVEECLLRTTNFCKTNKLIEDLRHDSDAWIIKNINALLSLKL